MLLLLFLSSPLPPEVKARLILVLLQYTGLFKTQDLSFYVNFATLWIFPSGSDNVARQKMYRHGFTCSSLSVLIKL